MAPSTRGFVYAHLTLLHQISFLMCNLINGFSHTGIFLPHPTLTDFMYQIQKMGTSIESMTEWNWPRLILESIGGHRHFMVLATLMVPKCIMHHLHTLAKFVSQHFQTSDGIFNLGLWITGSWCHIGPLLGVQYLWLLEVTISGDRDEKLSVASSRCKSILYLQLGLIDGGHTLWPTFWERLCSDSREHALPQKESIIASGSAVHIFIYIYCQSSCIFWSG